MSEFANNKAFFAALRRLIEGWCDRRCLKALGRVLPGYLAFDGLSDGWAGLRDGLRDARALAGNELEAGELELLGELIRTAERIVHRKPPAA